ncbi:MAG: hypothetical protein JWQ43_1425 [Glaciihabitans sp.]|nr:hypothetical protein [Glaciihabitans sp.]
MALESGALAEFLRARRKHLLPQDVGLPVDTDRRVQGLRRSEVAKLANISVQYYTRLEQGRTHQPSESVLSGLVRALALDPHAGSYLYRLALPTPPSVNTMPAPPLSDLMVKLVNDRSDVPVQVVDRNQDVLLANELALAMFPSLAAIADNNVVLSVFTATPEERVAEEWITIARQSVAALRFHGDPTDPRFREIVGRLSLEDKDFRQLWAYHHAYPLGSGVALAPIDGLGVGELPWQVLEVPGGYFMIVYMTTAGPFLQEAIDFLR